MARYLSLLRFTDQGARAFNQSASRAAAFRKAAEQAGVKVEAQYWTVGNYDGVVILSADSEEKVLRTLTKLAAEGNVRTTSLQALTADEFAAVAGR